MPAIPVEHLTARRRGLRNVEFIEGDAAQHRAENRRWDTIISRFGTLHFSEPARVFAQLARLLAPGGRIAFTAWQAESLNGWSALPAAAVAAHLPSGTDLRHRAAAGPFTLADPQRVGTLLAQAGLVDVELRSTSEPVWVASDIDDALEFFDAEAGAALRAVAPPETVEAVRDTLRDSLRPYAGGAGVFLPAAAWIATAAAPV
jgi:SAM-dependent methyltransferase